VLGNSELAPVSRFTDVPLTQVEEFAARLRAAGIWTEEGDTACSWSEGDGMGDVAFWLDVLIALGRVKKVSEDRYIGVTATEEASAEQAPSGAATQSVEPDRSVGYNPEAAEVRGEPPSASLRLNGQECRDADPAAKERPQVVAENPDGVSLRRPGAV